MNETATRCADGGAMCTDCEAQGRCGVDFEDSQRAALEDATRRRSMQTDRLVNWLCMAGVVAVAIWAVFA